MKCGVVVVPRACCSAVRKEASTNSSNGVAGRPRRLLAHSGMSGSATPNAASESGKNWEVELSSSREARDSTCEVEEAACGRKAARRLAASAGGLWQELPAVRGSGTGAASTCTWLQPRDLDER